MSNQTNQTKSQYFNLTSDGVGFVNRVREVQTKGKKGSSYFACVIQASYGDSGDKCRFDVRVVGSEAKEVFQRLLETYPSLKESEYKKHPTVICPHFNGQLSGRLNVSQFEVYRR